MKIGRIEAKARHLAFAESRQIKNGGETNCSATVTTETHAKSVDKSGVMNRSSSSLGRSSKAPTILEKLRMVGRNTSKSPTSSRPASVTRTRTGALASARSFTNSNLGRSQFLATQPAARPQTPG